MTCFLCKGTLQEKLSNFTSDMEGCIVVVKNVPSDVCNQCGETSYNDDVTKRLEQIMHHITDSAITEIAVINYSEKAA